MSMLPKKAKALQALAQEGAPRAFSFGQLEEWLTERQLALPTRSLSQALAEWAATGALEKLGRVYLNKNCSPTTTPDEAAPLLRPRAVVSLQRALGLQGVVNNPSRWITAVVPNDASTKVGRVEIGEQVFRFASLPASMFIPKDHPLYEDSMALGSKHMASSEKALIDWMWLASTPRGKPLWPLPPKHDLDLDLLDPDRLLRLAGHLQAEDLLRDAFPEFMESIGCPALVRAKIKI